MQVADCVVLVPLIDSINVVALPVVAC